MTAEKENSRPEPVRIEVEAGQRKVASLTIRRVSFEFGDVVTASVRRQDIYAIEATSREILYAAGADGKARKVYRCRSRRAPVTVASASDRGLVCCGNRIFARLAGPVAVRNHGRRLAAVCELRGNGSQHDHWPRMRP